MKIRKVIYADEGKVLTDGQIYGTQIFLADGKNESDFREISEKEYETIIAEQENGVIE